MASLKELLLNRKEPLTGGHRACSGCGFPQIIRLVCMASKDPVVVVSATGCLEVTTTIYPFSAWKVPFLHNAFENAAATMSGVVAAYEAFMKKGKIKGPINFVAFGGDGGTYDIGFQALSGAMERGHNFLYVCYNNEGYMNTGVQRSGATPRGANTTTEPVGKVRSGKVRSRKDLTAIMAAHNLPYVAQASIGYYIDLIRKAEKAFSIPGAKFLNVLQPCRLGWAYNPALTIELGKIAVDTCFWPSYEVENGKWKISQKPKVKKPLADFLKPQDRFRHLFRPGSEALLADLQAEVDRNWEILLERCGESSSALRASEDKSSSA